MQLNQFQNDTDLLFVNMFLFITSSTAMKSINIDILSMNSARVLLNVIFNIFSYYF